MSEYKTNLGTISLVFLSACLVAMSGCTPGQMSQTVGVEVSGSLDAAFSTGSASTVNWGTLERGSAAQTMVWASSGDGFEIVNAGTVPVSITMAHNGTALLTGGGSSWEYMAKCRSFGADQTDVSGYPGGDVACNAAGSMASSMTAITGSPATTIQCLEYSTVGADSPGVVIDQKLTVGIQEPLGTKTSAMSFSIGGVYGDDLSGTCGGEGYAGF